MVICQLMIDAVNKRLDGQTLDEIAKELCPDVVNPKAKIIRIVKKIKGRGLDYLINNADRLGYRSLDLTFDNTDNNSHNRKYTEVEKIEIDIRNLLKKYPNQTFQQMDIIWNKVMLNPVPVESYKLKLDKIIIKIISENKELNYRELYKQLTLSNAFIDDFPSKRHISERLQRLRLNKILLKNTFGKWYVNKEKENTDKSVSSHLHGFNHLQNIGDSKGISPSLLRYKPDEENVNINSLQNESNDPDWKYKPYLKVNTKISNDDINKIEGDLS